jgi:hypothetical protein
MPRIDFGRFDRLLTRCVEIGTDPAAPSTVAFVHQRCLDAPARAFRAAHADLPRAESVWRKAKAEAQAALRGFDSTYRQARGVIRAFDPARELPDTLKRQRTDTDQILAIRALLKIVADHAGLAWADSLAQGAFGQEAPAVLEKLAAIEGAAKGLAAARRTRAEAFALAHVQFIAFKRLVRDAHGPHSHQYRKIHLRRASQAGEEETTEAVAVAAPVAAAAPVAVAAAAPVAVAVAAPARASDPVVAERAAATLMERNDIRCRGSESRPCARTALPALRGNSS